MYQLIEVSVIKVITIIISPKTDPSSGLDIDLLINPISRMRSSVSICPPKMDLANQKDLPDSILKEKDYCLSFFSQLVSLLIQHCP